MSHSHGLTNLKFEIKVGRLTNFKREVEGNLFIRYYFFAGNNNRISVDTREIVSANDLCWSELALFECSGNLDHINELLESRNVVFELRRRRRTPVLLGKIQGSELLGRGELAWKVVLGSRDMSWEKWVELLSTSKASSGFEPLNLSIEMKIRLTNTTDKRTERRLTKSCDRFYCEQCQWIGSEEDIFQPATIID